MNEYIENWVFPSGLQIDYFAEVDKMYKQELDKISSQPELLDFVLRWRYLFPDINHKYDYEVFRGVKNSHATQDEFARSCDDEKEKYLHLLLPALMISIFTAAIQYKVTTGLVLMRMYSIGSIYEDKVGYWILKQ